MRGRFGTRPERAAPCFGARSGACALLAVAGCTLAGCTDESAPGATSSVPWTTSSHQGGAGASGGTAGGAGGAAGSGGRGGAGAGGVDRIVAVTLNTHSFQEGASSLEKLEQIGEGLAALEADIVGLNEVMNGTFWSYDWGGAEYDALAIVQQALEVASETVWYSARFGFAHWDTGELMSNALLSRWPIVDTDARALTTTDFWPAPDEQRSVGWARIAVPATGPLHAFVAHPWGWNSVDTETQIGEIKAFMAEVAQGDEVLEIIATDANLPSTDPRYALWIDPPPLALLDTYAAANPDGFADPTVFGEPNRIDFIFARQAVPAGGGFTPLSSFLIFTGEESGGITLPIVSDHKGVATTFVR